MQPPGWNTAGYLDEKSTTLDGVGDVVADVGGGGGRGGGRADEEGTVVGARGGVADEEGYIEVLRWGGVGGCRHVLLTEG